MASGMLVMRLNGLVTATGITSGVDGEHHHQDGDAVDPRVGDHGDVDGGLVGRPLMMLHRGQCTIPRVTFVHVAAIGFP